MSDCDYNSGNRSCVYEVMCIALKNMIEDANDELDEKDISSEQERKFHKQIADANLALEYVEKFSAANPGVIMVSEFAKNRPALKTIMLAVSEYHRLLFHDIKITSALDDGFGPILNGEEVEEIHKHLRTERGAEATVMPVLSAPPSDAADEDLKRKFERRPPVAKA